jgi:hypothetical protein
MNTLNKNNTTDMIETYMNIITKKCCNIMPETKKLIKITEDSISIPTIKNYHDIIKYNYNITQLKIICKNYKLKISGNKSQLVLRIYSYLYFSSYIIKIQQNFRKFIVNKYKLLHGPAAINRKLCNNAEDFITMEPLDEINFHQFLSYKDTDGFIYGFDIISLYNLFLKSKDIEKISNPYNRNIIPKSVIKNIKSVIRLSKILKININLHFDDDSLNVSNEKALELRTLSLFQNIDSLGNYSNPQWFLSLNKNQIIKLVRELMEIWNYRAQLTNEIKRSICPPNGDPFRNLSIQYIHTESNIINIKKVILEIFEKMVNTGTEKDNRSLGAYYVLGCLTLVNNDAATALPWLYQSFCYF